MDDQERLNTRSSWLVFSAFLLVPLLYAAFTQHAWEDWYITFRASKNLALGNGLVYTPGERLHTFTSPLGTLIPALLSGLTGNANDDLVLWLYRLVCAVFLGFTGLLLFRVANRLLTNRVAVFFLLALVLVDAKTIENSINGMETAIMLFFIALVVYLLTVPERVSAVRLGAALAGLVWTRPDGFIYGLGLMLGILIWLPKADNSMNRADWLRLYLRAGFVAVLLYAPWLALATWYYGSPIPNTILAKGLGGGSPVLLLKNMVLYPFEAFFSTRIKLHWLFAPIYSHMQGWPPALLVASKLMAAVASLYWLVPGFSRWSRTVSFACFLSCFYLSSLKFAYPWYLPMGALWCIISLAMLMEQATKWTKRVRFSTEIITGLALLIVGVQTLVLLATARQMQVHQQYVENNNRKLIGLWLRQNAAPNQTVFLECLGYIGFYSSLKPYDYPGLASREVVAMRQKVDTAGYPGAFGPLIEKLQPDWAVLRDFETQAIVNQYPAFKKAYKAVKIFTVEKNLDAYKELPGYAFVRWDAKFTVYKRSLTSVKQLSVYSPNF
jgi:hypothetical protein